MDRWWSGEWKGNEWRIQNGVHNEIHTLHRSETQNEVHAEVHSAHSLKSNATSIRRVPLINQEEDRMELRVAVVGIKYYEKKTEMGRIRIVLPGPWQGGRGVRVQDARTECRDR